MSNDNADNSLAIMTGSTERALAMADPDRIRPARPQKVFEAPSHITINEAKAPTFLWPVASQIEVGEVIRLHHEEHAWLLLLYVHEIDIATEEVRSHAVAEHNWRLN